MENFHNIMQPYLDKFKDEEGYFEDDKMRMDYFRRNPLNTDPAEIILKISVMEHNEIDRLFHSRQVLADHIAALHIDKALRQGDPEIVSKIAHMEVDGQRFFLYNFATRYNYKEIDKFTWIYGAEILHTLG